jgi:hypothetical protein
VLIRQQTTEMEFVFLNQIAGPNLPGDNRKEPFISVNNEDFVDMANENCFFLLFWALFYLFSLRIASFFALL